MNWQKRFWSKVDHFPVKECWLWTSYIQKQTGYGRFHLKGKSEMAHRIAWKEFRGDIPKDRVIDHKCRVRACVNPSHLQLVTRGENVLLGVGASAINKAKTSCPKGHSYDIVKKNGNRACSICKRHQQKLRYEAIKQAEGI